MITRWCGRSWTSRRRMEHREAYWMPNTRKRKRQPIPFRPLPKRKTIPKRGRRDCTPATRSHTMCLHTGRIGKWLPDISIRTLARILTGYKCRSNPEKIITTCGKINSTFLSVEKIIVFSYNHRRAAAVRSRILRTDNFECGFANRRHIERQSCKISDHQNLKDPRKDWEYERAHHMSNSPSRIKRFL